MARPSEFSPEAANFICERIALGESLRAICADEAAPDKATVFRWLSQHVEFRDQYAHAREMQAETYADEIVEIADKAFVNHVDPETGEGELLPVDHNRSRLRMDARKWAAAKLAPKKYGEAVQMKHTGAEGGPVEQVIRWAQTDSEATPDPSKR